jgi:hypothetical protein
VGFVPFSRPKGAGASADAFDLNQQQLIQQWENLTGSFALVSPLAFDSMTPAGAGQRHVGVAAKLWRHQRERRDFNNGVLTTFNQAPYSWGVPYDPATQPPFEDATCSSTNRSHPRLADHPSRSSQ